MLELGILKTWNATTYKAGVQLVGSLTTYLDDISVATNIAPEAMVLYNYVLVAIPGGNPRDACVVASWPAGSSGGGGGGTKIQDADGDTSWDVEQTADEDKVHGKVKGVEAFLLHDDGILDLAKQSYVFAYGNTDQSVPNATWTVMNLNTIVTDKQGEFNTTTHRFTAKRAGVYMLAATIKTMNFTVDGQYICLGVLKNGGWLFDVYVVAAAANKYISANGSAIVTLAANDYLELCAYQTKGAALTFAGTIGSMNMMVLKVA